MASSIQGIESVLKEIVHSGRITTVSETKQISVPGLQEDAGVDAVARANDTLPSWLRKFEDSNNENPALNTPTQNLTKAA